MAGLEADGRLAAFAMSDTGGLVYHGGRAPQPPEQRRTGGALMSLICAISKQILERAYFGT
jgi:hypothetical protein